MIDNNNPVVKLVADNRVAILQPYCSGWRRSTIAIYIGIGEVLPNDLIVTIHFHNSTIIRICNEGIAIGEPAGKRTSANS